MKKIKMGKIDINFYPYKSGEHFIVLAVELYFWQKKFDEISLTICNFTVDIEKHYKEAKNDDKK